MNVASLELCKDLYELSGWKYTTERWVQNPKGTVRTIHASDVDESKVTVLCPAYDLGYLLRKLPPYVRDDENDRLWFSLTTEIQGKWNIGYERLLSHDDNEYEYALTCDTPEDTAAKLAIELFKQKILT